MNCFRWESLEDYFISTKNCVLISLSDIYPEIISTKSPPDSHLISTTTRRMKLHGYQWRSSGDVVGIRWRLILRILLITKFLQAFRWKWRCAETWSARRAPEHRRGCYPPYALMPLQGSHPHYEEYVIIVRDRGSSPRWESGDRHPLRVEPVPEWLPPLGRSFTINYQLSIFNYQLSLCLVPIRASTTLMT